jgi:hypothetical protein
MSNLGRAALCALAMMLGCGSGGGGNNQSDATTQVPTDAAGDGPDVDAFHAAKLVAIQVTPVTAKVPLGGTQAYAANGIFSDASQHDITASVTWSATPATIATVSSAGVATSLAIGTTSITAMDSASGIATSAQLSVTAAQLTAIAISPGSATVANGASQQFHATGTFTDQSTADLTASVHWSVSTGTATIANAPQLAGDATTHGVGTSSITAFDVASALTATATLDSTDATLVSIAVTPPTPSIAIGATVSFVATGTFSDSHTAILTDTVTWSSSTAHVTVSNTDPTRGVATAVSSGTATVKALDPSGISGTAVVTVAEATPPLSAFGPPGQFTSVGHARAPSFPLPITVSIATARTVDTIVTVGSNADVALAGTSGGSTTVTIPAGQTSAPVPMVGIVKDPAATLTATTGTGATLMQTVRVIDYTQETPVPSINPATATKSASQAKSFSLVLDIPAQSATAFPLAYTNATSLTSPPASTTVAADQLSSIFTVTASATASGTSVISSGAASSTITFASGTVCTPSQVAISQVYGGGGNSGSVFTNDFVELFNRGTTDVDLSGWQVWIASATGTFTQETVIAAGKHIAAHSYYLVGEAAGAGGTTPLPTPDTVGTLALSAAGGKVILVGPGTITSGQTCPSTGVVDLVGAAGANCFEGTVGPAGSAANALIRGDGGCTDTNVNSADFTAAAAAPRNSQSPIHTCPVSCGQ